MPKKPFSGKQKKQQLQERRARRKEQEANARKADDDEEEEEEEEVEEDGEEKQEIPQTQEEMELQVTSAITSSEQQLRSLVIKDTDEDIQRRRQQAYVPIAIRKYEPDGISRSRWTSPSDGDSREVMVPLPLPPKTEDPELFKEWCRTTASHHDVSYFEVNNEVWKQLWDACDAATCVCIVVDSRYVAFHLPASFVEFVTKQLGKPVVVVLNKTDLVPQRAVDAWTEYIQKTYGPEVRVIPFTCKPSPTGVTANPADDIGKRRKDPKKLGAPTGIMLEKRSPRKGAGYRVEKHTKQRGQADLEPLEEDDMDEHVDVAVRQSNFKGQDKLLKEMDEARQKEELIELEKAKVAQNIDRVFEVAAMLSAGAPLVKVAMVGQPNVGKSSIINAVVGLKQVSVSATPGHTKHVQTVNVESSRGPMVLLDCPGLIFPVCKLPRSIAVVCGIFPFAQNREHFSAVQYIAERLPLEKIYGLKKIYDDDVRWSAFEISEAVAVVKGFYLNRGKGRPDAHRGAQSILVDAFTGRLVLYFMP
eukprot:PhF_6_TR32108/c0_g1_i1/m.47494